MITHKIISLVCLSYLTLNGMHYESRLQELEQKITDIGKQIHLINEINYEAATMMGCTSLGGIIHAAGYNPCLPYSLASILGITSLVRCLHPDYTDFHAITLNELEEEHRRLLTEQATLKAIFSQLQQNKEFSTLPTTITSQTTTLRKRTAHHEEA